MSRAQRILNLFRKQIDITQALAYEVTEVPTGLHAVCVQAGMDPSADVLGFLKDTLDDHGVALQDMETARGLLMRAMPPEPDQLHVVACAQWAADKIEELRARVARRETPPQDFNDIVKLAQAVAKVRNVMAECGWSFSDQASDADVIDSIREEYVMHGKLHQGLRQAIGEEHVSALTLPGLFDWTAQRLAEYNTIKDRLHAILKTPKEKREEEIVSVMGLLNRVACLVSDMRDREGVAGAFYGEMTELAGKHGRTEDIGLHRFFEEYIESLGDRVRQSKEDAELHRERLCAIEDVASGKAEGFLQQADKEWTAAYEAVAVLRKALDQVRPAVPIAFVSGHLDLTGDEFTQHYKPMLNHAIDHGWRFVIGDAPGCDRMTEEYLVYRTVERWRVQIFHMLEKPRCQPFYPTMGGYTSDNHRDRAMTRASTIDIAWVRDGKEGSGTARNIRRRVKTTRA